MEGTRTPIGLLLALWAAGLGAAAQFAKISVMFPFLQAAYPDAGIGLGFLVSLLSFLGIGLGLFAGMIVLRLGFRRSLLPALALGAAVSAVQALLPPLPMLLASRVIEGASHLVIVVAAPVMMARVSLPRHRAAAMTLWSTFFGVAFAIMAWLGLPPARAQGVSAVFLAHAVYMAAVAALLARLLPPDKADASPMPLGGLRGVLRRHVEIYRSPWQAAPAFAWLFYTLTFVSLLTLLPGTLDPEHRALVTGILPLAGMAVAMTIGIALQRRFAAVPLVMAGFLIAAGVVLAMAGFPGNPVFPVVLFGVLGLVQGSGFASIPQLNPSIENQAAANGAVAQMGNLGNTLGTPVLLAAMGAFGFSGLIGFAIFCYLGGFLTHLLLARRRGRFG